MDKYGWQNVRGGSWCQFEEMSFENRIASFATRYDFFDWTHMLKNEDNSPDE